MFPEVQLHVHFHRLLLKARMYRHHLLNLLELGIYLEAVGLVGLCSLTRSTVQSLAGAVWTYHAKAVIEPAKERAAMGNHDFILNSL